MGQPAFLGSHLLHTGTAWLSGMEILMYIIAFCRVGLATLVELLSDGSFHSIIHTSSFIDDVGELCKHVSHEAEAVGLQGQTDEKALKYYQKPF